MIFHKRNKISERIAIYRYQYLKIVRQIPEDGIKQSKWLKEKESRENMEQSGLLMTFIGF